MRQQLISILVAAILLMGSLATVNAQITPSQKSQIIVNDAISKVLPNGNWTFIDDLRVSIYGNASGIPAVENGTGTNVTIPIPPVDNGTIPIPPEDNQTVPPVDNQTEPIPPLPNPNPDTPDPNVNTSNFLRIGAIGDIDDNSGLVKQLEQFKKFNVKVLIIVGDFDYKENGGTGIFEKLNNAGFTKVNTGLVDGNHDKCSDVKGFTGLDKCYGIFVFDQDVTVESVNAFLSVIAIESDPSFGSGTTQFNFIKSEIEGTEAWYKLVAIHKPFVTVDSDHPPNGQFNTYDPVFKDNKVDLVLQAHNHNYQRINVNGLDYLTVGTGTHDTGSSMYDCDSQDWNGNAGLCITGVNGITIIDLQINDPKVRNINGWFLDSNDNVKDKW